MNSRSFALGDPSWITVVTKEGDYSASFSGRSALPVKIDVRASTLDDSMTVTLEAGAIPVRMVRLRWGHTMPKEARYLGDEWERGYGTMGFRGMQPNRIMPWYFLTVQEDYVTGYGVKTGANAMCFWQVDPGGITLVMDVRSGGEGVCLGDRCLVMSDIVSIIYETDDSFSAAREFCRTLCDNPLIADVPVYGSNNWYHDYGDSSDAAIMDDVDYLASLTAGNNNRPFMMVDDGWQDCHRLGSYNGGPWRNGNARFPDMGSLASSITSRGVHPGIWMRPLLNMDESIPEAWRLAHNGCLDPTHPEVLAYIAQDVDTLCRWGYQLIKHDFSTFDLFGRWGFQMNPLVTADGWHFHDRSMTSAEVVKSLYRVICKTAQSFGAMVLGCNTIGHLGAGFMHIARGGDDTSGTSWERTRFNGVNTLAFRLPQHGAFFSVDADCVGISESVDWRLNRQWAEAIARTGTPLFFSVIPYSMSQPEELDLRAILSMAAAPSEHAIPVDWELTDCPEDWASERGVVHYDWFEQTGIAFSSRTNRCISILSGIDE